MKKVNSKNNVIDFIKRFNSLENTTNPFLAECSYWFAVILFNRFVKDGATIVYDNESCCFATKINERIYDFTGEVTGGHLWCPLEEIRDRDDFLKIYNKYIMF